MGNLISKFIPITFVQMKKVLVDEKRHETTVKGIDRSHPLEPLDKKHITGDNNNMSSQTKSDNTNRHQSIMVKRVVKADVNSSNVNDSKPIVVSYQEQTTRANSQHPYVLTETLHNNNVNFLPIRINFIINFILIFMDSVHKKFEIQQPLDIAIYTIHI